MDNIGKQFTDLSELQAYCNAQYQTILDLSKKINNLEQEKASLESMLTKTSSVIQADSALITVSDDETICRIQLKKLADRSIEGEELTLEETKRVEIYSKLLINIKNGNKKSGNSLADLPDEDLIASLKEDNKIG
jgi:hypothetical protein